MRTPPARGANAEGDAGKVEDQDCTPPATDFQVSIDGLDAAIDAAGTTSSDHPKQADLDQRADPEITPEKTAENGGVQSSKTVPSELRWEFVNDVTWKLTRGKGTLVPACHGHWPGYHTTLAMAWVIGLGKGKWVARYKKRRSRPMTINKAKTWCVEMVKGQRDGKPAHETDLNLMTALIMNSDMAAKTPSKIGRHVVSLADADISQRRLAHIISIETGGA